MSESANRQLPWLYPIVDQGLLELRGIAVGSIADVPCPDTCVNPGEPVMTLLAAGDELTECKSRLIQLAQHWTARLGIVGDAVPAALL